MKSTCVAGVILLASSGLLAGCTTAGGVRGEDPYADEVRKAQRLASSSFEHDVLRDGVVTRAEYEESMHRYVDCAAEHGVTVSLDPRAGYYATSWADVPGGQAILDRCSVGTTNLIEPLYDEHLTNPNDDDVDQLMAHCFVAMKVVSAPFTAADLEELLARTGAIEGRAALGPTPVATSPARAVDPEAVRIMATPNAQNCMNNPSYDRLDELRGG